MMIFVAPSAWIRSCASRLEPSPTASIEITAATPKTIPSTVSPERSLCNRRLFIPDFKPRQIRPIEVLSAIDSNRLLPLISVSRGAVGRGDAGQGGGLGLEGRPGPGAG